MHRSRTLFATLVLPLVLAASVVVATPGSASADTVATAINTTDGSSLFDFAFQIRRVMHGVVDQTNLAQAYASCEDCQSVAVSFQVVLVTGDAEVVEPENVAVAVNEECSSCDTLASAYQFVLSTDGPVRFTAEGNRQLADMRRRLRELSRSDLGIEELDAEFDAIAADLREVLAEELVQAGGRGRLEDDREVDEDSSEGPTPSPSPSSSPDPVDSPDPVAQPSVSDQPTTTADPASADPTVEATAAASPTATVTATATATPTEG